MICSFAYKEIDMLKELTPQLIKKLNIDDSDEMSCR